MWFRDFREKAGFCFLKNSNESASSDSGREERQDAAGENINSRSRTHETDTRFPRIFLKQK